MTAAPPRDTMGAMGLFDKKKKGRDEFDSPVEQVDLSQVKRVDFEIISYLKSSHPDLYRTLRRAVKGRIPEPGASDLNASLEPADAAEPIDLPLADERPGGTHSF